MVAMTPTSHETLPCPIRDACGGCPWMERDAATQREAKEAAIARAVGRAPDAFLASPHATHYRARIRVTFAASGTGYHRPRTHDVTHIPACAVARPEVNDALARLHEALPPGTVRGLKDVELRSNGERVIYAFRSLGKRGRPGKVHPALRARLVALGWDAALDGQVLSGDPSLSLTVGGITHRLSSMTFYQVNLEANALLVEAVGAAAKALAPEAMLDLYAGAGNLSLPLAAAGVPVTLIEREGAAMRDARATAAAHGIAVKTSAQAAERYRAGDHPFDVALLDPPRSGADGVVAELLKTRPRGILYVSCNPHTLGRDVRPALKAGYRISAVTGFDFFPQTPHVETLCVLER